MIASATAAPRRRRPYSLRELALDRGIHWTGIGAGVAGVALLALLMARRPDHAAAFGVGLYGACLLTMLGCSAAYHLAPGSPRRELRRRLDHAAIFLLIAGTCTPFASTPGTPAWSWLGTWLLWAVALAGAALKLAAPARLERVALGLYLALGWLGLVVLWPIFAALGTATVALLCAGGVLYSAGTAFYVWRRLPFQNAIWHGFVLSAAACHYGAVLQGVVLDRG